MMSVSSLRFVSQKLSSGQNVCWGGGGISQFDTEMKKSEDSQCTFIGFFFFQVLSPSDREKIFGK